MSLRAWWKRRRLDEDDFSEEIRSHLAMAAQDRIADGADPQDARLASLKEFGNVSLTTDAARRVWTPRWLDAVHDQVSDVRYAIRNLARNPGFSATVVAVLTLGIGLNAAVFTMLKSMALSPLAGVERSAALGVVYGETGRGREVAISYPDYQYLRDHDGAFSGLLGTTVATVTFGRGRGARPIFAELVTGNYFQVLGVDAALGRTLLPSDEAAGGGGPVVVLSDGLWRRDFGADPHIVGRTLEFNNRQLVVAGVADASFHGSIVSYDVEAFIPITMGPELGFKFESRGSTPSAILGDERANVLWAHGRLREGTTLASAAAQTDAIWTALSRNRPITDATERLRVVPFWRSPNGAQTYLLPTLVVLTSMGLLVLVIACANIAGLVLVRGLSRRGEVAVRLALGATRWRVVRLLVAENLALAVPGAIVGVLLAYRGIPLLVDYAASLAAPQRIFFNIALDRLVIGFAAAVACGCALVFGFVPALQSSRVDLVTVINEDASPRGAARSRLRAALVVAQVAVSLLLLVGAGLATRTVDAARRAYPGYDPSHVTAVALDARQNAYDEAHGRVFYRRLLDAARADSAVDSATLAAYLPLALVDTRSFRVAVEGHTPRRGEDLAFMGNIVGPDYFRTLSIPLLAGREFEDRDDTSGEPVAIVNDTMARRFWGSAQNAVGKRVRVSEAEWRKVVGVAADVKYLKINEAPRPYVYTPLFQTYRSAMVLHTKGPGSVDRLVDRARAYVAGIDPEMPIESAKSMARTTRGAFLFFELTATMLFAFGAAGLALAAMGTYGLVSYTVKQSTHEIGIRMALGATAGSVVRTFLARGVRLGAIGAAVGMAGAVALGMLLSSVLFGVSPTDPATFAQALAIVIGSVVAATLVPAWRAARTNPLTALRHQ
jgi:putative ABC transport system permease protein